LALAWFENKKPCDGIDGMMNELMNNLVEE
jgi:hypothetical protein